VACPVNSGPELASEPRQLTAIETVFVTFATVAGKPATSSAG